GARDSTLHKYVGQAISLLYYLEGTTPAHIYALFLDPVLQLDDEDGEDWLKILWSAVGRLWVKEEAKANANAQKAQEFESRVEEAQENVLSGMREWCNRPELNKEDSDARMWAERRFIVSSGQSYYLI